MFPEDNPQHSDEQVRWLSGAIVTPLNMYVFPYLWYAFMLGLAGLITVKSGHIPDVRKFGLYALWLLVVTAFVARMAGRTKRVGIAGGHLVVSSYFREERIPFRQVQSVDTVWWAWRRLVRLRFGPPSSFGDTIYYIPKWAPLVALYSNPANQLRLIMSEYQSPGKMTMAEYESPERMDVT